MIHTKILFSILVVIVLLISALGAGWWFVQTQANKELPSNPYSNSLDTASTTAYQILLRSNTAFSQAEAAKRNGEYAKAEALYREALQGVTDSTLDAQIRFKIAGVVDLGGDTLRAIELYKDLAKRTTYRLASAYAVQQLGEILNREHTAVVRDAIFKDEPYASMVVEGEDSITDRHLEEYASSFYPLGLPEARIALWYARAVADETHATGKRPDYAEEYFDIIRLHNENANADVLRTASDPNANGLVPYVRQWQAVTLGALAGIRATTRDKADELYQRAFASFAVTGNSAGEDGNLRFFYANFLNGSAPTPDNVAKIRSVLQPLYTNPIYTASPVFQMLESEKDNLIGQKATLIDLASVDPNFKQLLTSLGWKESDFAQN